MHKLINQRTTLRTEIRTTRNELTEYLHMAYGIQYGVFIRAYADVKKAVLFLDYVRNGTDVSPKVGYSITDQEYELYFKDPETGVLAIETLFNNGMEAGAKYYDTDSQLRNLYDNLVELNLKDSAIKCRINSSYGNYLHQTPLYSG